MFRQVRRVDGLATVCKSRFMAELAISGDELVKKVALTNLAGHQGLCGLLMR
jgi:hypothetical protein